MGRPTVTVVKMRVEDLHVGDVVDVRDHNTRTPGPKWERITGIGMPYAHQGTLQGKIPLTFRDGDFLLWYKPFDILPTQQVSE